MKKGQKRNKTYTLREQTKAMKEFMAPSTEAAFEAFSQELLRARREAEQQSKVSGYPAEELIDVAGALKIAQENPEISRYLTRVWKQAEPVTNVLTKSSPTGSNPQDTSALWGQTRNQPQGVANSRLLRDWSEKDEWIRAAINIRKVQTGRADVDCAPIDPKEPFDEDVQKQVRKLLSTPNEKRESYTTLIKTIVEDMLVLDRGVILKSMTVDRFPQALYFEDGATIKIYPGWSGNPWEYHYLWEEPGGTRKVPLYNDECIVFMDNHASYRLGLSPVQVLKDVVQADLAATRSAMRIVEMKPPPHIVHIRGASEPQLRVVRSNYEMDVAGQKEIFFLASDNDARVFPMVFSAKDNQWMEWQVYLARKIAAIFNISPQQLGITMDINKASAGTQQQIYEDTGLIPLLLTLEEYWNLELLSDYAPGHQQSMLDTLNLQIVYPEVSEAARQVHIEKMIALATTGLAGLPSMTLNEVLAMRGADPVAGGNAFWVKTAAGPVAWVSYEDLDPDLIPVLGEKEQARQDAKDAQAAKQEADQAKQEAANQAKQDNKPDSKPKPEDTGKDPSSGNGDAPNLNSYKPKPAQQHKEYTGYYETRHFGRAWGPHQMQRKAGKAPDANALRTVLKQHEKRWESLDVLQKMKLLEEKEG